MDKWIRARFQPCMPLGDHNSRITESQRHIALSREAAHEGSVLLKNENALLPLKKGQKISIFGKAQIDYVKGGGGSGDVTVSYVRNIYEGLKLKADHVEVLDELSFFYQDYVNKQYKAGQTNGKLEEPVIPAELLAKAKEFSDTAIITLNRYSCEMYDRYNDGVDKYYDLSDTEQLMIDTVCENFSHVIVLLNTGSMINTAWFAENDKIEAALMLWQGGMEGGLAAADLLVGEANPSGKLVDTCAKTFDDYPSSAGFHESKLYVKYTEDIFVGYRYFETVPGKKDCVVYPFGYGLSYTTFAIEHVTACDNGKKIFVTADVTNTGNYSGKEVVQLYYSAPTGKITKPALELAAFAKTPLLEPGETHTVILSFDITDMALFDDTGIIQKSAYVMEAGSYQILVGNSVRNAEQVDYHYDLAEDTVVKQLHSYCRPKNLGQRMLADGTYITVEDTEIHPMVFPCEYECPHKEPADEKDCRQFIEVAEGTMNLDDFLAQLSDEEMMQLLAGSGNCAGISDTGGIAGLKKFGIPEIMTADGPAGIRVIPDRNVHTTAFPVATALACTWNTELVKEIGKAGALEAKENNLLVWLTPALNIHRSPLCGRNFEYYSEDPLIAGKMAAAKTLGIQSQRVVATPKHFACNNKETHRWESDSILSERALREIYLKGFEICVREAKPKMIMTSYNILNSVRASESAELITGILRNEWGYKGMVISDWNNEGNHYREVLAGSDVRMPVHQEGVLMKEYKAGNLSRNDMAVCVRRILEMLLWLE